MRVIKLDKIAIVAFAAAVILGGSYVSGAPVEQKTSFSLDHLEIADRLDSIYQLNFSWSPIARQDTLLISESLWTKCYLWGRFEGPYTEFLGFDSGYLFQTNGVHAYRLRYLLSENSVDYELDPYAVNQVIGYFGTDCRYINKEIALFEFDVYIDASLVDLPGSTTSLLWMLPPGISPQGPEALFRINPQDDCGVYSVGIACDTRPISVHLTEVSTEHSSFGHIKAMYR